MPSTKCIQCGNGTWSTTKSLCLDCIAIKVWKKYEIKNLPFESHMSYGQYVNNPGLLHYRFGRENVI